MASLTDRWNEEWQFNGTSTWAKYVPADAAELPLTRTTKKKKKKRQSQRICKLHRAEETFNIPSALLR